MFSRFLTHRDCKTSYLLEKTPSGKAFRSTMKELRFSFSKGIFFQIIPLLSKEIFSDMI